MTSSQDDLVTFRSVWEQKPVLRLVYEDLFQRLIDHTGPGPTLELGGGIGNLREMRRDVWSSDIQFSRELDLVADAQRLPFRDASLGNIVMLDVLHHLEFPIRFLREAARVLRPGGRVVAIEPAITWGSSLFYRLLHREPVIMSADPLKDGHANPERDPYDSNQAIPTLLATSHRERLRTAVPELELNGLEWFSLAIYPLSGGFQRWSLVSEAKARSGLAFERKLEAPLGRLFGFRLLMCLRRSAQSKNRHSARSPVEQTTIFD